MEEGGKGGIGTEFGRAVRMGDMLADEIKRLAKENYSLVN